MLGNHHQNFYRVLSLWLGLFFCFIVQGQRLHFADSILSFGGITVGDTIKLSYHFQNISQETIFIDNIQSTCGCTVPNWTKQAIQPNQKDSFEVEFHSKEQQGHVHKLLVVDYHGGTKPSNQYHDTLVFHGDVFPPLPQYQDFFPYKKEHLLLLTPVIYLGNIQGRHWAEGRMTLGLRNQQKEKVQIEGLPKGTKYAPKQIKNGETTIIQLKIPTASLTEKGWVEKTCKVQGKKSGDWFLMKLQYQQ